MASVDMSADSDGWSDDIDPSWGPALASQGNWGATAELEHLYWFGSTRDGFRFMWDGDPGATFDGMYRQANGALVVTDPARRRVAYFGVRGDRVFVGVNGSEDPEFENLYNTIPPTFSPDGGRLAYGAWINGKVRLIVDGALHSDRDVAPLAPVWSPDGARLAFVAQTRELQADEQVPLGFQQWVVLDGRDLPPADAIVRHKDCIQFSPDSHRFAYGEVIADKVRAIVDGSPHPWVADLFQATFSPDGRHFAYAAKLDRGMTVIADGVRGPLFDDVGPPIYSPEGSRLLFVAMRGDRWSVVVDGRPGPEYHSLKLMPGFSPDGRHVAYLARRAGRGLLGRLNERWVSVVDGNEQTEWDEVGSDIGFSLDGAHLAFAARRGKLWSVVVDGEPGLGFDEAMESVQWGPRGHLAYVAYDTGRTTVVLDDTPGAWCWATAELPIGAYRFSPDGAHVAWIGRRGDVWSPVCDQSIGPGGLLVHGPGFRGARVEFVVVRDDGVHRVSFATQLSLQCRDLNAIRPVCRATVQPQPGAALTLARAQHAQPRQIRSRSSPGDASALASGPRRATSCGRSPA